MTNVKFLRASARSRKSGDGVAKQSPTQQLPRFPRRMAFARNTQIGTTPARQQDPRGASMEDTEKVPPQSTKMQLTEISAPNYHVRANISKYRQIIFCCKIRKILPKHALMHPQKVADSKEDFCGTAYAAKVLGLSVGTIQSLVEKNELRAWKTNGGHRRIAMDSLLDYQKRNNGKSTNPSGTADRLKVLVVDDDPIARELFSTCLAMWDLPIDFTVMSSAFEALIDLSRIQPDVLLTDLRMPGMDGFELLRTLRQNPAFNHTHLLAITGMDADEIREKGGLPDRTVCKQKPIDMNWLNGYLVALLSQVTRPQAT